MLEVLTAGALAGVLSAPHCALMCGPIGLYSTRMAPAGLARYLSGRTISYGIAGLVAGSIGRPVVEVMWSSAAVHALSWALAATMLYAAYQVWPRVSSDAKPEQLIPLSKRKTPWISRALAHLPKRPEILGATSLLLPCAALWSGLVLAASSGRGFSGGAVMVTFALTSSVGFLVSEGVARFLRRRPSRNRVFSVLLVVAAIFFVMRPMAMTPTTNGDATQIEHCPLHPGMTL